MVDTFDYNNPKIFEKSLLEHMDKYDKAVKAKDGYGVRLHYGAIQNMEHRLMNGFNYTADQIQKVKERKQNNEEK